MVQNVLNPGMARSYNLCISNISGCFYGLPPKMMLNQLVGLPLLMK